MLKSSQIWTNPSRTSPDICSLFMKVPGSPTSTSSARSLRHSSNQSSSFVLENVLLLILIRSRRNALDQCEQDSRYETQNVHLSSCPYCRLGTSALIDEEPGNFWRRRNISPKKARQEFKRHLDIAPLSRRRSI